MNYAPLEDDVGPSFPVLDDELANADTARDYLLNAEVFLPVGDSQKLAQVVCWKHDTNGALISTFHKQSALDTLV